MPLLTKPIIGLAGTGVGIDGSTVGSGSSVGSGDGSAVGSGLVVGSSMEL